MASNSNARPMSVASWKCWLSIFWQSFTVKIYSTWYDGHGSLVFGDRIWDYRASEYFSLLSYPCYFANATSLTPTTSIVWAVVRSHWSFVCRRLRENGGRPSFLVKTFAHISPVCGALYKLIPIIFYSFGIGGELVSYTWFPDDRPMHFIARIWKTDSSLIHAHKYSAFALARYTALRLPLIRSCLETRHSSNNWSDSCHMTRVVCLSSLRNFDNFESASIYLISTYYFKWYPCPKNRTRTSQSNRNQIAESRIDSWQSWPVLTFDLHRHQAHSWNSVNK